MSLFVDDFYLIASNEKSLDSLFNLLELNYGDVPCKEGDVLEYPGMSIVKNVDGCITTW